MRELKFRQWLKNTREFHYWGYIMEHGLEKRYGKYFVSPIGHMDNDPRESKQYTGLKDKNGKEIYEGDVVTAFLPKHRGQLSNSFGKIQKVGKVVYEKPTFLIILPDEHLGQNWIEFESEAEPYEIIGNVYQNPELLEGE